MGGSASGAFFGTGAEGAGSLGGNHHRQPSYLGGDRGLGVGGQGAGSSSSSLIIDTDNLTFEQLQLLQHGKGLGSLPMQGGLGLHRDVSGGSGGMGMPKPMRPLNTMGPTATVSNSPAGWRAIRRMMIDDQSTCRKENFSLTSPHSTDILLVILLC